MYSASELIAALLGRGRKGLWFREQAETPPGEFPPGWRAWFASMQARTDAVTGATAAAILAILVQREPASPPRASVDLDRWQVFGTFWREGWHPPERESRRDRVSAWIATAFVHLLMLVLWTWLIHVRVLPSAPVGDSVVQVEFIGEGTPEEQGGGPPEGDTPTPAEADSAPAPAASAAVSETVPAPAPPAESVDVPPVAPQAGTPTPQPLQVTETPVPDTRFVLPPTTPRELEVAHPQVRTPSVALRTREIELREAEPVPAIRTPQIVQRPLPQPAIQAQQAVREREITAVVAPTRTRELARSNDPSPQLRAPSQQVRAREILMPAAGAGQPSAQRPAQGSTPSATAPTGNVPAGAAAAPGGAPSAQNGAKAAPASSGRGPAPSAAPGAWPTPRRGDDWGDSDRNRPGGTAGRPSGLFNADGSPRLPPGTAAPGFPPGSDDWTIDKLDRYGTWMKRPPNDYQPTTFERYWLPQENLLEQWVRQGVKSMSIPIPGTSKKITCVVSLLQLGGACSVSDPNLQDQEATARPPPVIPFKKDLQEDNGSRD